MSWCALASLINRPHYEMTGTTSEGHKQGIWFTVIAGEEFVFPSLVSFAIGSEHTDLEQKQQRKNHFTVQSYGKTVKGKPSVIRYFKTSRYLTDTRSLLASKRSWFWHVGQYAQHFKQLTILYKTTSMLGGITNSILSTKWIKISLRFRHPDLPVPFAPSGLQATISAALRWLSPAPLLSKCLTAR